MLFWLRPPFLIITDPSINMLYGAERTRFKQIELSIKFFRRIIPVLVSDSAAPEIIASTVESFHADPGAVLFPELYLEAAQRYNVRKPGIPVIVLGSRRLTYENMPDPTEGFYYIRPDTEADLYEAGINIAFLAENYAASAENAHNSNILVIYDIFMDNNFRTALERGLGSTGFSGTIDYIEAQNEHILWENYSYVVLIGSASHFLEQNTVIPIILFSWLEPTLTPFNVKVIFNDSPWVLAGNTLEVMADNGSFFSSEIIVLHSRIHENSGFLLRLLRQYINFI